MKRILSVVAAVTLVANVLGCSSEPSTTSADSLLPRSNSAVADKVKAEPPITVPAGAKLRVALLNAVSSDKSQAGDEFRASLTEPVIVNGKTVFAKGTKVRGRVVGANESGRVKGRARLELTLTQVVADGDHPSIAISTKNHTVVAESSKKRDAALIGGGAGVGAAIGAITGGGKGAAIGAAVGSGAGTGTVLATKGKEIRYGVEHPLSFTLAASIQI
jgi:hypothetical protein